ncbi:S-layer homology domain-containing protein [Altericista sp. CCNU0014]|uniref:S-layer homology domain-containing protein n=1 Tax=Altericista sp. CCNU0014 TaxID=3082949 RepID=UPI0038509562
MKGSYWLQSGTAWALSLSAISSLVAGWGTAVRAQTQLSDIQGVWANRCITSLAERRIINGYPDGTFRPNASVTRAEFATMLGSAFPTQNASNSSKSYGDVSRGFWAYPAIQQAAQSGFLTGYPDGSFRPAQNIPRVQVLVALANGLNYRVPANSDSVLTRNYDDADAVPSYANGAIAAATAQRIVVNYPEVKRLDPNRNATRAEVAAFLCQALKEPTQTALVPASYIVGGAFQNDIFLNAGETIPVKYTASDRILVTPTETVDLTLTTTSNVKTADGVTIIPAGSQIEGVLKPQSGGSQFVAQTLRIDGESYPISASSAVVSRVRNTRDINLISLARNSAIGAGVAAGISGLAGDRTITAEKVLAGAATGAAIETNRGRPALSILRDTAIGAVLGAGVSGVVGDRTITPQKVISGAAAGATIGGAIDRPKLNRVVVIEPNTDLTLNLNERLVVAQR